MRRILLGCVLTLGLAATRAPAQACGPFNFTYATTGAGCAPPGAFVPTLQNYLDPANFPSACWVGFLTNPGFTTTGYPFAILALGTTNPTLDLAAFGFPGCFLRTSADMIVPAVGYPGSAVALLVPPDPAFVGTIVYGQYAVATTTALGAIDFRISNGVSVSL